MENGELGSVRIDNEVLGTIAGIAAKEVPGVYKIITSLVGGIAQLIRKTHDAGIKVIVRENEVSFELGIIIEYGVDIPEITYQIQKKIKEEVERITGLKVIKVDVVVHGVHYSRGKQKTEKEGEND
ncbi:MAG TPA: Asp23/Gls24 family envelope stress response protein [Candidatus Ratteibacteria bacterium]|nr:Asp23/Gls24 family envelope stress response protein [Candidatus Ratteibacteria bacterium]